MFLAQFGVEQPLSGKIVKIVIYDKARVIGRTNYDPPVKRWVPQAIYLIK